jgi:hypothetical protein
MDWSGRDRQQLPRFHLLDAADASPRFGVGLRLVMRPNSGVFRMDAMKETHINLRVDICVYFGNTIRHLSTRMLGDEDPRKQMLVRAP